MCIPNKDFTNSTFLSAIVWTNSPIYVCVGVCVVCMCVCMCVCICVCSPLTKWGKALADKTAWTFSDVPE